MDFPASIYYPPPILTPFSPESLGTTMLGGSAYAISGTASSTWLANNLALYYPFRLSYWATARQLLFWVGATSAGNIDVGIYDSQKNLIVSAGSTAMSATVNTVQELNITDTVLSPGDYLLGAVCSSTTGTVFRNTGADELTFGSFPIYEQAVGSSTLPATATPVLSTQASPPIVVIGIQFASAF